MDSFQHALFGLMRGLFEVKPFHLVFCLEILGVEKVYRCGSSQGRVGLPFLPTRYRLQPLGGVTAAQHHTGPGSLSDGPKH